MAAYDPTVDLFAQDTKLWEELMNEDPTSLQQRLTDERVNAVASDPVFQTQYNALWPSSYELNLQGTRTGFYDRIRIFIDGVAQVFPGKIVDGLTVAVDDVDYNGFDVVIRNGHDAIRFMMRRTDLPPGLTSMQKEHYKRVAFEAARQLMEKWTSDGQLLELQDFSADTTVVTNNVPRIAFEFPGPAWHEPRTSLFMPGTLEPPPTPRRLNVNRHLTRGVWPPRVIPKGFDPPANRPPTQGPSNMKVKFVGDVVMGDA